MGLVFFDRLARQRSLASAALLFLLLVDEIEGLVFLGVGVLGGRPDVFVGIQDVVFPVSIGVAGAVTLARHWRRPAPVLETPAVEPVGIAALTERIGAVR